MELYVRQQGAAAAAAATESGEALGQDGRAEVQRDLEHPQRWQIELDGRTWVVDAVASGASRSLLIDGHQYEVLCQEEGREEHGGSRFVVSCRGLEERLEVLDPLAHEALLAEDAAGVGGSQRVTAYMPGKVVKVLVEAGARVEAGQGVLVLEAMKMENEIQAESSGVLAEIFVSEGQAVQGGDPLFEVVAGGEPE